MSAWETTKNVLAVCGGLSICCGLFAAGRCSKHSSIDYQGPRIVGRGMDLTSPAIVQIGGDVNYPVFNIMDDEGKYFSTTSSQIVYEDSKGRIYRCTINYVDTNGNTTIIERFVPMKVRNQPLGHFSALREAENRLNY